jgi:hypothetical protein
VAFSFLEIAMTEAIVAALVQWLDANLREDYEERAGIMEFDANQPREHAECLALLDLLRRHPAALIGVTAFEVEMAGASRVVMTTDAEFARQHLAALGIPVVRVVDLAGAVQEHCGGMALLARFG